VYKIAHISDLHFSQHRDDSSNLLKNLLEKILGLKCEHIIITGDIVSQPNRESIIQILKILKRFNLLSPDKLTLIPGNHDIFGGARKNGTGFYFPSQCKSTDYNTMLSDFFLTYRNVFSSGRNEKFPFIKVLNNNVALIGFNSVAKWDRDDNPIGSNGYIDDEQIKNISFIKDTLEQCFYKIALIHHHFYYTAVNGEDEIHSEWLYSERNTMQLNNRNKIMDVLKSFNINYVCHGHTHYTNKYQIDGINFINSSGCVLPFSSDRKKYFHILEIPNIQGSEIKIKKINFAV